MTETAQTEREAIREEARCLAAEFVDLSAGDWQAVQMLMMHEFFAMMMRIAQLKSELQREIRLGTIARRGAEPPR